MKTKRLICKKCGHGIFEFMWQIKDDDHEMQLFLAHPGIGFQLEDAIIICVCCGASAKYEEEDFLEVIEQGMAMETNLKALKNTKDFSCTKNQERFLSEKDRKILEKFVLESPQ